jgi:D-alanyl-D-alanine carboxypeptidase
MMCGVQARRWDVAARHAAALVTFLALGSGCAQTQLASPPAPEFTHGLAPATTVPEASASTLTPVSAEEPDLEAVEPDFIQPEVEVEVDDMVIVDDAGNVSPNISGWEAFDDAIERRLIPGDVSAAVSVMKDGVVVHEAAFGERILGSAEPTEVGDRFRIASISKTVTAIVVMQLVEEGLLTLDDPIGQMLIDHLHVGAPDPQAAALTVRELLSHTAGLGKYQSTFFGNGAASYVDAAAIGLSSSIASPGRYSYSNMSYCLLTVLIEAVTGKTYERVVQEHLLEPLGIDGMRITGTYEIGPDEVSHHPAPGRKYMEALGGAGSWNATPTDLVTILNSIDPDTPGWKALSPESMLAMRYKDVPADPALQPPSAYGLGIINYPGAAWGHTGTIEHIHSMVLVQPDGVTWAVSVSGETPSSTEALRSIVRSAMAAAFPD